MTFVFQVLHIWVCYSLVPPECLCLLEWRMKDANTADTSLLQGDLALVVSPAFLPKWLLAQAQKHAGRHSAHPGEAVLEGGPWV